MSETRRGGQGMVTVVKMKATSTTLSDRKPAPSKQRKRKKGQKDSSVGGGRDRGRGSLFNTEKETDFRLSQEFPNSNWLERKIQLEIQQAKKQEKRFDEDDEDKELVVDVEKEAHPCIAISEDNDGIQVSVLGLGGDPDQGELLEETKSGLEKFVMDHSHLLQGDMAEPRPMQAELTREIEQLRSTKTTFVEDLINLKSFKEKQFSKVENLKEELLRENHVLYNLHRETRDLKQEVDQREREREDHSRKRKVERKREDCYVASLRKGQNYQENPMPNFNFHSIPGHVDAPYLKYNSRKPLPSSPYDPKLHHLPQSDVGPPHYSPHPPSYPQAYWPSPQTHQAHPHYSYSTPSLATAFSSCDACGRPANFLCSACKTVHYCTPRCQKRSWQNHREECAENTRKRQNI